MICKGMGAKLDSLLLELGLEVITYDKANKIADKIISSPLEIDRTRLWCHCSPGQTVDL